MLTLPGVLYECKKLYLAVKDEHTLKVLENRVLWKMFGKKG
jgi:hypothetical protein